MIYFSDFEAGGGGAPTDPNFSSTVLLLSCDGSNGSTTLTDESAVLRGNASITGASLQDGIAPKFGSNSLRFDGVGDFLSYADSADWLLSGDFTIEAWVSFDASFIGASTQVIASQWETGSQRSWLLQLSTTALQFTISTNGTAGAGAPFPLSSNWTPTADTWYHIAVDRSGNTWRLYLDGVMLTSLTSSSTPFNSTTAMRLGASAINNGLSVSNFLKGNIDEPRITKGVARYASDSGYTVPTAAFPRS